MKKILYSLLFMKKKMNYNFKIQKTFLKKINIPYRKEKNELYEKNIILDPFCL